MIFMKIQATEISEGLAGFIAGVSVLGVELYAFVGSFIFAALSQATQQIASISGTAPLSIPSFGILFIIIDIIENFAVGLASPEAFTFGFIAGDLIMIFLVGSAILSISPSIIIGMIIALVSALAGLFLKSSLGSNGGRGFLISG